MKKSLYKFLLLIPVLSLSACGYSLRELYNGSAYNEGEFEKNFYRDWDEDIKDGSGKVTSKRTYALNKEKDYVFTSYKDDNFAYCDPKSANECVYEDEVRISSAHKGKVSYGAKNKLSGIDDSFHYGHISKLFEGNMFCDGRYQQARVQIDEKGFGKLFKKEIKQFDYFALNFKSSLDYTIKEMPFAKTTSKINLYVSFFMKNGNDTYSELTVSYPLENVPTNTGDSHDESCYMFFGFKLDKSKIDIERCCGVSVGYDLVDVNASYVYNNVTHTKTLEELKNEHVAHSLMLYELLLPNSTWH